VLYHTAVSISQTQAFRDNAQPTELSGVGEATFSWSVQSLAMGAKSDWSSSNLTQSELTHALHLHVCCRL